MLKKIRAKLLEAKFREQIFKSIIFVTTFRYLFSASFIVSRNRTAKFRYMMIMKYFILQIVLYVPFLIYEIYFNSIFINNLKKSNKNKPKRISKIGIYSPWLDKFAGGGEQVAVHLAQFFENKFPESEVEIICDDWYGNKIEKAASLNEINVKYGTNLLRTKINYYTNNFYTLFPFRYEKALFKLSSNYDIYINCFINCMHGYGKINLHYIHFPIEKRDHKSFMQFKNYKNSYDYYITNSKYTEKWTKKYYDIEKTKVIYPPVIIPQNYIPSEKSNVILTVGRFDEIKCLEVMIDTFLENEHLFGDYEFHLAGALNPKKVEYFGNLQNRAKSDKIKFFTNLTFSELQNKYKDAKIYWQSMGFGVNANKYPGSFEHFGITIVEAISYGCVPVVFNNGGPAEIVNNDDCGITWTTKNELTQKTYLLIKNNSLYHEFQQKCIIASKAYSVENFKKEMNYLIDNILEIA